MPLLTSTSTVLSAVSTGELEPVALGFVFFPQLEPVCFCRVSFLCLFAAFSIDSCDSVLSVPVQFIAWKDSSPK